MSEESGENTAPYSFIDPDLQSPEPPRQRTLRREDEPSPEPPVDPTAATVLRSNLGPSFEQEAQALEGEPTIVSPGFNLDWTRLNPFRRDTQNPNLLQPEQQAADILLGLGETTPPVEETKLPSTKEEEPPI